MGCKAVKRICVVWIALVIFYADNFGLEFGTMGQVSASMGGAGVALKDSAWGLFYNPALLGADRRAKFGYSFGVNIKEQKLAQLATIDVNNLQNMPNTLTQQLTGSGSGGTSVTINGQKVDGALGGMLNALFPSSHGTIDKNAVQSLMQEVTGSSSATCTDVNDCWGKITSSDALSKLKDKLSNAAIEGGSPLVGAIIDGIDESKLTELMKEASSGKFNAATLLEKVGPITLSKGADSVIDQFLDDFGVIDSALKGNDMNVVSQNGFVFQISGDRGERKVQSDELGEITIEDVDSGRGATGVGIFTSLFANAAVQIDPQNNKLIFNLGGKYYQISVSGSGVTLQHLSTQNNLNGSIMNSSAKHQLHATTLSLTEVPIGYGHTIFTRFGELNVGLAVKFIQAFGYGFSETFSVGKVPSIPKFGINDVGITQTFGLDLGMLYTPSFMNNLNVGLVVKNLNAPVVKSTPTTNLTLNTQVRAGMSYIMKDFLTFAFDVDVLPNNTLSFVSPKSQFVGGGVLANFDKMDFRLGLMHDFRSNAEEGLILTAGLNFLGFLDVTLQYGLGENYTVMGYNLSNYLTLRAGGQFSF